MLIANIPWKPLVLGLAVVPILSAAAVLYRLWRRLGLKRELARLRFAWGDEHERERDLKTLREFNQVSTPRERVAAGDGIEDQTWNDLNMDAVYARVDRTFTTAGACLLYRVLRTPVTAAGELARRGRVARLFQDDVAAREALQLELLSVGRSNARGLISLVWTDGPPPEQNAWSYVPLTVLAVVALAALVLVGGPVPTVGLILVFGANMSVHYRVKAALMGRLSALRQLGAMIAAAARIAGIDHPELSTHAESLRQASGATRRIARKVALLTPEGSAGGDIFATVLEYVSIFFLHEVRTFHVAMVDIANHRDDLRTLFTAVGELDAWQSVAAYRAGLGGWVEPQFVDVDVDDAAAEPAARLEIRDARHPLFADPVANSIAIHIACIAITGSNMSGKSSFLRTIGVNVLLAQTINTCLATHYRARPLRIISSMDESDDLLEGKSYYLAEAERLLTVVRQAERGCGASGGGPLLALIDEPLAGTNSPERLAASREILRHLAAHNGLVLVSTHDVELVSQLQQGGHYDAYHFSDQADDQGIRFDYRLRPGLDYHGNAIKVLKYLGFPDGIIDGALATMPAVDGTQRIQ